MRIKKMLHAALLVTDLEKAKAFYGGVLGLKEKTRHSFNFPGAWYDLGDAELHLMVTESKLPVAEERPQRDFHVAFEIEDFEETRRAIADSGLAYREGRSGLAQLFVRDPDGNLIELQKQTE
jgi:catechol 2,3-dioxygenase-like lactoylglutathione lyase family enzyme